MFRFFENLLRPTDISPETPPPALAGRHGLLRFYLHFIRQVRPLLVALFFAALLLRV